MLTLEPSTYRFKSKGQTLLERQQSAAYSATDYGRLVGMKQSAQAAWDRNMTMTAARWVKTKLLDDDTDRVTREEFDKSFAPILGLEYKADENRAQLDYRIGQGARFARQAEMIEGENRMISNFAASFAAGVYDPVNIIPFALPAKAAKATIGMHTLAGNRGAAAFHQGKLTFKNVLAVNAALEVPYAAATNDIGVERYTEDHLKMSVGMNLLMGGVFGTAHGYYAGRKAASFRNVQRELDDFNTLMEADDFSTPLRRAVDDNPTIREMINENPRISDFLSGKDKDGANLTPEDLRLAVAALDIYVNNRKLKLMQRDVAQRILNDKNYSGKSILEGRKALAEKMGRITETVLSGKVNSKLTKDDLALLDKYDIEISNEGSAVHRSKSKTVPANHPSLEHALSEGLLRETASLNKLELELASLLYDETGRPYKRYAARNKLIREKEAELQKALEDYYDRHGDYFNQIEEQAVRLVNKTFMIDSYLKGEKFSKGRRVLTALSDIRQGYLTRGAVVQGDPRIRVELPHRIFNASRLTPLEFGEPLTRSNVNNALFADMYTTLMHESIHVLQEFAPDVIAKLTDYADSPLIAEALNKFLVANGYMTGKFDVDFATLAKERPAVLLEWAMGQEGYWMALHDADKGLYRRFIDFISEIANNIAKYLGKSGIIFDKSLDPKYVAYEVGRIMSELQKDASLGAKLKKAYDENPSPSDITKIDVYDSIDQSSASLSKNLEDNNFNEAC